MKVDAAGRAFITALEGEILWTYKDAGGVLTQGVGHTGPDVKAGQRITKEHSQVLLTADLARFEAAVNKLVTRPLTQRQFNALVSFAFNVGAGGFAKSSLLQLINAGVTTGPAITAAFALWHKVAGKPNAGLLARRQKEANYFLTH